MASFSELKQRTDRLLLRLLRGSDADALFAIHAPTRR